MLEGRYRVIVVDQTNSAASIFAADALTGHPPQPSHIKGSLSGKCEGIFLHPSAARGKG